MSKSTEKEKFPTWVYPLDGGEPRIVELPEGSNPPKGHAFSPAGVKQDKAAK